MKFTFTSALCLGAVLLTGHEPVRAQAVATEEPPIACFFPIETYGQISRGDEKARLDNLAIQLLQDPELLAYIFVYAGKRPCPGELRRKIAFIKTHFVKTRGVPPDRVILQDGGHRDELTVETWLWPRTGKFSPPLPAPHVDASEVGIRDCRAVSPRRRGR